MLSGLMIVQDEEECLARAIDSFHDHVDELIILDGGSVDATRKIAGRYEKVKLLDMPMPDDFAVQLNRGIELVAGEWVVRLDADEYFDDYATACLPHLVASGKYDAFAFSRKTFIDGYLVNVHNHDYQIRLFRKYCRYESNEFGLHESVIGYTKMQLLNLDIKHYKLSEWQHKDNIRCWDAGQPPPPGWEKRDGAWAYTGTEEG